MININDFTTLAFSEVIASDSDKKKRLIVSFSPANQKFRFYIQVNGEVEITNFLALENAIKRYNEI